MIAWNLTAFAAEPGPHYTDVTDAAVFERYRSLGYSPSALDLNPHPGPAWADWDGDGDLDLPGYRNDAGVFTDVSEASGLAIPGFYRGATWGDYDGDGDFDAIVLAYTNEVKPDFLFRNGGDGTFTDVAAANGMNHAGYGETANWADYDGDGDLDLLVANYECGALWWNDGDGTFTEGIVASGIEMCVQIGADPCGTYSTRPEGMTSFDVDGDGWLDVYAAGHLWQNQGDGTFVDRIDTAGALEADVHDESFAPADIDNDGDLDLMIFYQSCFELALFEYEAGTYTQRPSLPATSSMVGARWADADNDGDLDLFVPDYYLPYADGWYRNDGGWAFTWVADWRVDEAGAPLSYQSTFASFGDYDRDGDLDLAVWKADDPYDPILQYRILRNDLDPVGGWVQVRVLDEHGHATENGATVRLAAGNRVQTRYVDGGTDWAVDAYDVHFGVNDATTYHLSVTFPRRRGESLWVVDDAVAGCLALTPGELADRTVEVWRDGAVFLDGERCVEPDTDTDTDTDSAPDTDPETDLETDPDTDTDTLADTDPPGAPAGGCGCDATHTGALAPLLAGLVLVRRPRRHG